jgi:hypothetical protein
LFIAGFRCELLDDDRATVIVNGSADGGDGEWILDTAVEGCDAARRLGTSLVVDARFARLERLGDVDGLSRELCELCAGMGVHLVVRTRVPPAAPAPG